MELDTDKSIAMDFATWQRKWWGGDDEVVEQVEAVEKVTTEAAIWDQIVHDSIDVMANANASRYHTLNWLLNLVLIANRDDLMQRRDDLLALLKDETKSYLELA